MKDYTECEQYKCSTCKYPWCWDCPCIGCEQNCSQAQEILENRLDIDDNQVYDTETNDIIEDVEHMSDSTLKNLLREE
ncbi:hypothetical protein KYB31_15480 [Clostridium felsineum]|uniref:hypothetical protein n=1 Tax=Clostridium felsineum TaxID=36839 RepID=UPI00214DAE02|nr:hypothetical protein [Clostridium felsineum]MCR3760378.1 hypothetical protein [Clostridium felsineum]